MSDSLFAELTPPYSTIVADPPWHYKQPYPQDKRAREVGKLPYSGMSLDDIKALPVSDLAENSRLFMWTTNHHLRHAWDVVEAWGFEPMTRVLVWCKPPRATKRVTTEFVLIGKRGSPAPMPWHGTTWFNWPVTSGHSVKPAAFGDLVESWCPGPYVELFARQPRLGWDAWGHGYETTKTAESLVST